ncbi:portal protein [Ancylobacter sp. WKF20]|uniref:portal protein n=1 Tax=Ancylobacter sp. WKF20 TaxID=3039801 RepID=UPI0024345195|nr:portal protein [Ancylobacter sp. WKF20]WGD31663.1 portal protein [Ancylobacter sp. WKF20]
MTTAASRYGVLEVDQTPYRTRAEECAKLTIPTLVPPVGAGPGHKYVTPFQSIGARGVNNLASKLLLALLPPNAPFFRYKMEPELLAQANIAPALKSKVEEALGHMERRIMSEVETTSLRVSIFEALKYLIVAGNVLLQLQPDNSVRVWRLGSYVVRRDPSGRIMEILTREEVDVDTLEPAMKALVEQERGGTAQLPSDTKKNTLTLYTWVRRADAKWTVHQEIGNTPVPGSDGTYPLDASPFVALRFSKVDGEHYGRSYVEEYLGDLASLEALSQAIVEGTAAAAKVLFLVNPNGTTRQKTLTDSPNGAVRTGNKDDVGVLQVDKAADFRVALETIQQITQRLAFAFLLNTAVQRKGERVTAEEVRYMAGEIEDALGGVYSILALELQPPLLARLVYQMRRQRKLPKMPSNAIRPAIVTGLEALGRGHDLTKLNLLLQQIAPLGQEVISERLNVGDYITRVATALSVETQGLVRSDEEVQQARAAQAQQAMAQQLVDKLGPGGMNIVRDQLNPSNQQEGTAA